MKQCRDPLHKYKNYKKGMNYLNDSGEFHEVESNYCGIVSHVPVNQQGFQVRDLCLAATSACHLIHALHLRNVSGNPRSTLESSKILYQGIHPVTTPSTAGEVPALISTGALVAGEEERIGNTIPIGYSTEFYG